jgi:hypothetical protein
MLWHTGVPSYFAGQSIGNCHHRSRTADVRHFYPLFLALAKGVLQPKLNALRTGHVASERAHIFLTPP